MVEIPRDTTTIPPEVLAALQEAKAEEDVLRAHGATEERIRSKVGLGRKLAHLAARGIDISAALPPATDTADALDADLTPEEEALVDHLVDTGVFTYDDARRRVRNH